MASRNKRVMKEIQDCQKEAASTQINIQMIGEDLSKLRGQFPGPANSPYEGGTFEVAIEVPPRYPFEPLKMKFITKVYHPNVSSQSGAICLDILKDAWSPVLTLKTTLVSLQSLLCSPEPNDPQDAEVAKVYLSDRSVYERTARYWTEMYASGGAKSGGGKSSGGKQGTSSSSEPRPASSTTPQATVASAAKSSSTVLPGSARTRPSAPEVEVRTLSSDMEDQIMCFGLDRATVTRFQTMGFSPDLVIKVLIDLKYQPPYVNNDNLQIPDDEVLEALLLVQ
ncbi:hypothetical protein PtA15_8A210 [Puccinia triticina]|uniref:UBC core domain-containing protein n=1 Tax=Puccinia triticina TaxID=208348 RepID=A0ABY7CPY3_9BASI|nr:uncharacterized protein PtA15_8A210 [Puccinia triticina]WAQ87306.1 hypothetical protein PtA15_8A210 [Puccinia triticina]WAR57159.1 hypothetical protein PtB15_8B206 [Puccinia triticina]